MKSHDRNKSCKCIIYGDANNLYGWAVLKSLLILFSSFSDDGPKGFILEADLKYPEDLWESRNDYPLAP